MKLIKSFLLPFLFTASLFLVSCIKDPQFKPAEIGVSTETLDFGVEAGSAEIYLYSNRDWHVEITSGDETPTWLTLSDTSGVAIKDSLKITITVLQNDGEDRQATINFRTETIYGSVRVSQTGAIQKQYTPISTVRALYQGSDVTISEDYIIKGSVISNYMNSEYGGLNNATSAKTVIVSDGEYGISLYLTANNTVYALGDQITVKLKGLTLQRFSNGSLQVNAVPLENIEKIGEFILDPVTITAEQLVSGAYESVYVAVPDVEIETTDMGKTFVDGENHTSIKFISKTEKKFVLFSSKYSTFGSEVVPTGSGTLKGIAMVYGSTYQMSMTSVSDYAGLTGERFTTGGGGGGGDDPTNTISVTELVSYIKTNMSDVASGSQKELNKAAGFVEGIVAANNDGNNLYSTISLVDNTGAANSGILLYNSGITGYSVGDKIKVALKNAMYKNYSGLREVSWDSFDASYITKVSSGNSFTIPEITATQVNSNDYQGMYVKIKDLTSDNAAGTVWNDGVANNVNTKFKDASGNVVLVRTYKTCTWAGNTIATGVTSSISGVAEIYNTDVQVFPTKEADIAGFNGQSGPTFSLSPSTKTVAAAAGTFTINVNASEGVAWTVSSSDATNFAVSPASGTAAGTVTVTYTENTSETDARTATITFVTEDASITNKTITCAVTQSKKSSGGGAVYTSNVTLPTSDSSSDAYYTAVVKIDGSDYNGLKLGKSAAAGTYTIPAALPATGNCTLNFYGVAWKSSTCTVTVTINGGGTIDGAASKTFALNPNDGASGNPPFTIAFGSDFYTANLAGITSESTITLSTSADTGYRCVLVGININAAN